MFFSERANLVSLAIDELQTVDVRVVAVTCDMPSVHLSMMTALGAKLNPKMPSLQICKEKEVLEILSVSFSLIELYTH